LGDNDLSPPGWLSGLKTEVVPKADQATLIKTTINGGPNVVNVSPVLRRQAQVFWELLAFYA